MAPWNSATIVCLLASGSSMLACFLYIERIFVKYPLIPLSIFRNWRDVAVTIVVVTQAWLSSLRNTTFLCTCNRPKKHLPQGLAFP